MAGRVPQLLDAAIEIIAEQGIRQLTHRAVDARAGLPLGSTSNHFRTRESLLGGVLDRILERETAAWRSVGFDDAAADPESVAAALGALVRVLDQQHPALTRARYALVLEANGHPELRHRIEEARTRITTLLVPLLAAAGSRSPQAHVRLVLALVDGLLVARLTAPHDPVDATEAIGALLRGLTGPADRQDTPTRPSSTPRT